MEDRRPRLSHILILAGIAIIVFAWSYAKWFHPIIDSGRDLYIPEQLRAGAKLYRDIRYFYPPLAPYLLAAITTLIGSSLNAYVFIGLVTSLIIASTLYALGRDFGGRSAGFTAALFFIAFSFTGATARGCNFIFPYAHAATFGMMFFLLYMLAISRFALDGRGFAPALAAGIAAGWTKIEFAAFVAATLIVVLIWKRSARHAAIAAGAIALSIAAVALLFRDAPWFSRNVWWPPLVHGPITRHFYREVIGIDDWPSNLLQSIIGAVLVALIAGAIALVSRGRYRAEAVFAVAALSIAVADQRFFRAWSVLQIAIGIVALRRRDSRTLLLLMFSLCGSSRIYLNLTPSWYGFVFMLPAYIFIAYVLFSWLPDLGIYLRRAALLSFVPIGVVVAYGMLAQRAEYAQKRFPVVTERGTFYDDVADRAAAIDGFLRYVREQHVRSLVVMPEGIALNYFARIPDPLTYNTFSAPEIANLDVERDVVREIEAKKPDRIAINNQFVKEFGVASFGEGYGREIRRDIAAHYDVERRWHSPTFSIVLLRRAR
jgi:hypothetical protein